MAKQRLQKAAIRCHASRLMGEKRVRVIDVARATGVSRNMIARLYYDRAQRVDLEEIAKICAYLGCSVGELFELVSDGGRGGATVLKGVG